MLTELNELVGTMMRAWHENAWVLLSGVGLLWGVHILNVLFGYRLCVLGIHPRQPIGLLGVIFSPLLHGSVHHLFMNTIPGVILAAVEAQVATEAAAESVASCSPPFVATMIRSARLSLKRRQ